MRIQYDQPSQAKIMLKFYANTSSFKKGFLMT